eukprot:5324706-Pleurochrysis_carterae.AAC.4
MSLSRPKLKFCPASQRRRDRRLCGRQPRGRLDRPLLRCTDTFLFLKSYETSEGFCLPHVAVPVEAAAMVWRVQATSESELLPPKASFTIHSTTTYLAVRFERLNGTLSDHARLQLAYTT